MKTPKCCNSLRIILRRKLQSDMYKKCVVLKYWHVTSVNVMECTVGTEVWRNIPYDENMINSGAELIVRNNIETTCGWDDGKHSIINLTFVGPCIVIYFYSKINQMHNMSNLFYFGNNTLHILCLLPGNSPASEFRRRVITRKYT